MRTLIYPGTFDPFTNGHVDIARRAARLCDHLIVAILTNSSKKTSFQHRRPDQMAQLALQDLANIRSKALTACWSIFTAREGAAPSSAACAASRTSALRRRLPQPTSCCCLTMRPACCLAGSTWRSPVRRSSARSHPMAAIYPAWCRPPIADMIHQKLDKPHLRPYSLNRTGGYKYEHVRSQASKEAMSRIRPRCSTVWKTASFPHARCHFPTIAWSTAKKCWF